MSDLCPSDLLASDHAGRYGVLCHPHRYLGVPVDPGREPAAGLERLGRKRREERLLRGEVLSNRASARTDPTRVIPDVPDVDEGVEFREGVDLGDGDEVVTAEPRSEEHTSELQSLMRISYAGFCLEKTNSKIR